MQQLNVWGCSTEEGREYKGDGKVRRAERGIVNTLAELDVM